MSKIKSDIEIARASNMKPIGDILALFDIPNDHFSFSTMGRHIAKLNFEYIDKLKKKKSNLNIKKKKWIAAVNRFKNVLKEYETTIHVEESIHRLVEIYYKLGMEEESLKYASLLGYNYQSSEWYEESYKILNKNYIKTAKKENSEKERSILQKFKDLLK